MQIKIIKPEVKNWQDLEREVNEFLSTLEEPPLNTKIDIETCYAVIEYERVRKGAICCECRFWDDSGSVDELMGLCQRCGGRKRFNGKACNKYEDTRR